MSKRPKLANVQICLQKTLSHGPRRCTYRRWEAAITQATVSTQIKQLERLYRGNTPYPVATRPIRQRTYPTSAQAKAALASRIRRLLALGYQRV